MSAPVSALMASIAIADHGLSTPFVRCDANMDELGKRIVADALADLLAEQMDIVAADRLPGDLVGLAYYDRLNTAQSDLAQIAAGEYQIARAA